MIAEVCDPNNIFEGDKLPDARYCPSGGGGDDGGGAGEVGGDPELSKGKAPAEPRALLVREPGFRF